MVVEERDGEMRRVFMKERTKELQVGQRAWRGTCTRNSLCWNTLSSISKCVWYA